MPTIRQMKTAIGQAIVAIPDMPTVVWENRTNEPDRPFVLVDFVPTGRTLATVDGSETRAEGYIMASACITQGKFTNEADDLAQAIIDAFPPGLRIGGECITVARDVAGYFDGVGWRQPVRIDYRSEN